MSINLKKITILVVEDLKPMRTLMADMLTAFGVGKVYEAANGQEGYELFQIHNPDIVITDWLMEPVDGLEMIQLIRQSPDSVNRLVPVIMITGYSALQRVILARDLGTTEFLTKPFTGRDLAKRINLIISRPRDFVETEDFFGPNRRRRRGDDYRGPRRREEEKGSDSPESRSTDRNDKSNPWEIIIK